MSEKKEAKNSSLTASQPTFT